MQLRLFLLLLVPRLRISWDGGIPQRAAAVLVAVSALAVPAAGFALAVIMARHGPCTRQPSYAGRPHWVLSCGRRQP